MLYDKLEKKRQETGLSVEQLSERSNIPVHTIQKILNGEIQSPPYAVIKKIETVLFQQENTDNTIKETGFYNAAKEKTYTINDYYALPEDVRAELIDGMLIYMDAPTFEHQDILGELLFELKSFVRSNRGECKILAAPLDVQLDCDDKTIVQPDIVISCDKKRRTKKGIYGAPDMCIEITSPATHKRDLGLKMAKYMNAGVREYWIVDLKHRKVICYDFTGDNYPVIYSFQDKIPVHIFAGKLEIDFSLIETQLSY